MHFVLHGDEGSGSAWARRATVGNPVALWGPRSAFAPPEQTEWLLLVADETGLPATAAILEQLPPGRPAIVIAEVADERERQHLRSSPFIDVTWRFRDGAAPGTTTLLLDAVRSARWLDGNVYAWGGGESHAMTAIRKYLRSDVGLPRASVSLTGYWRRSPEAL
jgi:NADPH-dependent ferric siderophore reductase